MEIFLLTENIQGCSSHKVLFFFFFNLHLQVCILPLSPALPWMGGVSAALHGAPAIPALAQQPDTLIRVLRALREDHAYLLSAKAVFVGKYG